MKQITFVLIAIIILCAEEILSSETWKLNSNYPPIYFCDIDYYDTLNIIAVGHVSSDRARAYYSSDGGKIWEQILPDSAVYVDPNNRIGGSIANSVCCKYEDLWLIGCDKNIIIKTTNKGANWQRIFINTRDSAIYQLNMASKNIGYCRTWYSIFKTTDGGSNWKKIQLPKYSNKLEFRKIGSMEIIDTNSIIINYQFDSKSRNFQSSDGGLNWAEMIIDKEQVYQASFSFTNNETGWALTQYFIPGPFLATKIWKTVDSSVNWSLVYDSKGDGVAFNMQKILFLDNERGFIYQNKYLYRTYNGGVTWEQDEFLNVNINDADFAIKKIVFVNNHKGYFINKQDKIYEYEYNSIDIIEQLFQEFTISPNPAGDFITVNLERCATSGEILIYNTLGEKVMAESIQPMTSSHRMNIEALPRGIYFVKVGGETAKFVKM